MIRGMMRAPTAWVIDPDDPRAPPQEIWDRMSPEERERVVEALPSEFEVSEVSPPEGDFHYNPKASAKDTLSGYFRRIGRSVYLACELPVYYPGQRMFAPDLIAVVDVEVKERNRWSVSVEGKGLDVALEILWHARPKKDLELNVARYAALGIPEYFVFDRKKRRLKGYRLDLDSARYQPIVPQLGRLPCAMLGLELGLEGDRLRFYHGLAPLPEASELLESLGSMVSDLEARIDEAERRAEEESRRAQEERQRAEEESRRAQEERQRAEAERRRAQEERQRAEEESRRAQEERQRTEEAERRLAEALAEIERLKGERG
jgi:Putative restriction endonuclease